MASVTITYSTADGLRIAAAYGKMLGLEGSATAAQVKQMLAEQVRTVVRGYERQLALDAIAAAADVDLS